jgi:exopolysaccharide biosynthesis polyprenyl glycosylphosphotransferase
MASAQLNNPAVTYSDFANATKVQHSRERFEMAASALERIADLAAVMAAVYLAYSAYRLLEIGRQLHYSNGTILTAGFAFAVAFVMMLDHDGAYEQANSLLRIRETERILRVSTQALGMAFTVNFFISYPFSRWVVVLAAVFIPLLLVIERQFVYLVIRLLHSRGYGLQNVLVYGAGFTGRRVFSTLIASPKVGLNPVAIVDDDESLAGQEIYGYGYNRERSVPVIAGPPTGNLIREWGVSLVVVGIPSLSRQRLNEIAAAAFAAGATIAFVPQLSVDTETSTDYVEIDGVLICSLVHPPRKRMYETAKRAFDFVVALALLVLTAPLWALFAALIRLDSKGPVFFRQLRVGRGGRQFGMYKFRSMRADAPEFALHPTAADDPRVTRFGRWLRRTSLDELPQLVNILKGDMSLVGPRPEMPFIVESYNARHWQRLNVTPGLTGLWQLSADRAFLIHENIQYDLYYIRNRNFFMDMAILLHTAVFAMKGV